MGWESANIRCWFRHTYTLLVNRQTIFLALVWEKVNLVPGKAFIFKSREMIGIFRLVSQKFLHTFGPNIALCARELRNLPKGISLTWVSIICEYKLELDEISAFLLQRAIQKFDMFFGTLNGCCLIQVCNFNLYLFVSNYSRRKRWKEGESEFCNHNFAPINILLIAKYSNSVKFSG